MNPQLALQFDDWCRKNAEDTAALITPLPEPARTSEEIVRCSRWLGELEAARVSTQKVIREMEAGNDQPIAMFLSAAEERLAGTIEALRGRSPSNGTHGQTPHNPRSQC